jgi:DNA-binding MarR family transcriptional regulator
VAEERDFVDALLASWAESRPDLDVAPVAVVTRLNRVREHLEGEMAAVFGSFGLTAATFVLLATLTRLSATQLTEARIATELGLPEGTIAVRVDRLVDDGLATRWPNGTVELTPRGRELGERVVHEHLDTQARLLSALSRDEQSELAGLLRKLMVSLEGPGGASA